MVKMEEVEMVVVELCHAALSTAQSKKKNWT